jgi:3-oxoacyl-[acyl-carrier protein] reductase
MKVQYMERYLITGASRGIGKATAIRLAQPGRTLLLHGRDKAALEQTASLVKSKGGSAVTLIYDLSIPKQVESMITEIGSEPLDVLINNAGIGIVKPAFEHSLEEWQRTIAVNITAPFLLMKGLIPKMAKGSSVVNILSIAAKNVFPNWSSYCMSKFALDGFTRSIREELRSSGIRVINIYPGSTNTDIWNNIPGNWPREQMIHPEDIAEAIASALIHRHDVVVEDISLGPVGGAL